MFCIYDKNIFVDDIPVVYILEKYLPLSVSEFTPTNSFMTPNIPQHEWQLQLYSSLFSNHTYITSHP